MEKTKVWKRGGLILGAPIGNKFRLKKGGPGTSGIGS